MYFFFTCGSLFTRESTVSSWNQSWVRSEVLLIAVTINPYIEKLSFNIYQIHSNAISLNNDFPMKKNWNFLINNNNRPICFSENCTFLQYPLNTLLTRASQRENVTPARGSRHYSRVIIVSRRNAGDIARVMCQVTTALAECILRLLASRVATTVIAILTTFAFRRCDNAYVCRLAAKCIVISALRARRRHFRHCFCLSICKPGEYLLTRRLPA